MKITNTFLPFSRESAEGPWTVKLSYDIGEKFLEFCPTRDIRYIIWHAEDKAGSIAEDRRELANSVCLEEIRYLRFLNSLFCSNSLRNYSSFLKLMLRNTQVRIGKDDWFQKFLRIQTMYENGEELGGNTKYFGLVLRLG